MAVRGTTPDYVLTIEGYDLTDKTVFVTFAQGRNRFTKGNDDIEITISTDSVDGVEITTSAIALTLTQQDTLFLKAGPVSIQVKWIDSDAGVKILQVETGIVYEDALDVPESGFTYTETDIAIEDEITDSEALSIIMGRDADEPTDGD